MIRDVVRRGYASTIAYLTRRGYDVLVPADPFIITDMAVGQPVLEIVNQQPLVGLLLQQPALAVQVQQSALGLKVEQAELSLIHEH
jgi:hypothetical protein